MKTYTITAYKISSEAAIIVEADNRLDAEKEARYYFSKNKVKWARSKVKELYRVTEEG
mgnify:CR=1 FL=1